MTEKDYRLLSSLDTIANELNLIRKILEVQFGKSKSLQMVDLTDIESYFESKEDDGK
ncbi:MAG: hypothetical protein IKN54_00750 [Lachnospiraceae bacterium]|nr:hypothetical protein [Lachnospiraceae bacterium]